MRVPAVASGVNQTAATVAVFGYGAFGQAVAGLLAAGGHQVHVLGDEAAPEGCDIWSKNGVRYSTAVNVVRSDDTASAIKRSNAILVAAQGTEYGTVCEDLAPALTGGQVILIMGAAVGASFEVGHILSSRRPELALSIVEISRPFTSWDVAGRNVRIGGLKNRFIISGRTLNETRAGISVASQFLPTVVPASNVIERAFADADKWLDAAKLLFTVFNGAEQLAPASAAFAVAGGGGVRSFDPAPSSKQGSAVSAVVSALQAEIASLARAFRVSSAVDYEPASAPYLPADYKNVLGQSVIEDFVILSGLARLMYLPVPVIDSVIELSSVVTGNDLRKEARQLEDLGFIGMDAREIIEQVSA